MLRILLEKRLKSLTKIQSTVGENSISVQTTGMSKGVYFMTITVGTDSKTEKLIIQ
ncbi:MAG: T9SS type A sorting domain-containing protein [Bacteroidetes bacterium]|nr:T9SS type A sorting domain-containing protein [Bacteroidota bacterium]